MIYVENDYLDEFIGGVLEWYNNLPKDYFPIDNKNSRNGWSKIGAIYTRIDYNKFSIIPKQINIPSSRNYVQYYWYNDKVHYTLSEFLFTERCDLGMGFIGTHYNFKYPNQNIKVELSKDAKAWFNEMNWDPELGLNTEEKQMIYRLKWM